jgi:hypothetical protein
LLAREVRTIIRRWSVSGEEKVLFDAMQATSLHDGQPRETQPRQPFVDAPNPREIHAGTARVLSASGDLVSKKGKE